MAKSSSGKPCGASYIAGDKTCRVNMPSAVGKALNAATGEIGAASLKKAVRKYAGEKGVVRLREIRAEIRGEMGGNIVKGPKADEMKKRLQEEGLLPKKKPDSAEPAKPSLREELKELAAKDPQASNPKTKAAESIDPALVPFATDHLKKQLKKGKKLIVDNPDGPNRQNQEAVVARIEKELAKRTKGGELDRAMEALKARLREAMKPIKPASNRPDSLYGGWETNQLKEHRDYLSEKVKEGRNPYALKKVEAELKRRGEEAAAEKPKAVLNKPDSLYGAWSTKDLQKHRDFMANRGGATKNLERANAELDRRAATKPDPRYGKWGEETLKEHLSMIKNVNPGKDGEANKAAEIKRVEKELARRKAGVAAAKPEPANTSANTKWAKSDAKDFDSTFTPANRQGGTYDWNETNKSGTKKLGEGSFGVVLLAKGPPPVAVKRGEVSSKEALIIDKVGKADLGPKLIAGETSKGGKVEHGVKLKEGRIAMTVVPGEELGNRASGIKVGDTTVGDAYWKARADLHRLGVAHNDTHIRNLLIDQTGKGRWVDMGLAQDQPGAALAEALGVFRPPSGFIGNHDGDWQGKRWDSQTGNDDGRVLASAPVNLKRMQENRDTKVLPFLRSKGLSDDEIGNVMTIGIRRPPTDYVVGAGFNKLDDAANLKAINLLYDGI